jgi:hypothetical protein
MDTKTLVKALKTAVREVIKEELTEILREGLQSTINEMTQPKKSVKTETVRVAPKPVDRSTSKPKVQFTENKWASILNETDGLVESNNNAISDYAQLMSEGMDELRFTSKDAQGFGMMRQQMQTTTAAPKVMEDPETGKVYDVTPEVAQAMTRDYSALMKAINKKKS